MATNEMTENCGTACRTAEDRPVFRPSVDVHETSDELVLVADVPGASAGDIELQFEKGVLRMTARVPARQGCVEQYLAREYGVGDYARSFRIGEDVDVSRINAAVENGVLTIRLPKAERARARRIAVNGK